ncbi:ABC transporter ATP-binding protein [Enterovirga rhinocerotis]|uniref:Branched-chain amino acid transport system ATP-binding protein n=1 Tax=Enterovirga rhinocerotis TaxID=1339210 RepID=A0A4R7BJ50_9HYPH|nr:ABC transporter ATP-binding protein [Enterovirga rhinocerotis]TDR85268.1 branched-chain amino acid transport system ATP-binding protein [Enterovirga rhinocerotis]
MSALLSVNELSRSFGGIKAVAGVGLSVDQGEIVGLVGPNGAGKTTLFNLITGTLKPDAGQVVFGGRRLVAGEPGANARLGLARSFQQATTIADLSVRAHLERAAVFPALGRPSFLLRRSAVMAVRERAAATVQEILVFAGLDRVAEESADALPYGLQKILGVAMALATGPKMLLADEPAAGLNGAETLVMEALLRRIRDTRGIALMVIEHDVPLVMRLSDRIVALAHGTVIAEGKPAEVRADRAFIEAYLGGEADFGAASGPEGEAHAA